MNGMSVKVVYEENLKKKKSYVFCPNHTSALDILSVPLINENFTFVGKNEISKIPLFGYMFRKLHITVDRESMKSKYKTITSSIEAIKQGKSILIFPEGGIVNPNPPHMAKFKDGPFRIAIESGVPIVPVTIPYNWIILPDENVRKFNKKGAVVKLIVHKPIETAGLTLNDLVDLKSKTFSCISEELKKQMDEY